MLTRIVKMHFNAAYIEAFKKTFAGVKPRIESFPGCISVKLMQQEANPEVFFTISIWNMASDLEAYRQSQLFTETWSVVKPNFKEKAEAWSLLDVD